MKMFAGIFMSKSKSIVVVVHFNPCHYKNPVKNFYEFLKHLPKEALDDMVLAELSFDGQYDLEFDNKIEFSTGSVLWQKESMINAVFEKVKDDYDYFFWVDHDLISSNNDWYEEAKRALEYGASAVQCFSRITYLNEKGDAMEMSKIAAVYGQKEKGNGLGPPGGMWGARTDYLKELGGLYDKMIVGAGDRIFAGAAQQLKRVVVNDMTPSLNTHVNQYLLKGRSISNGGCEYVMNDVKHLYHGTRNNRQYSTRNKMLLIHNFSPIRDLEYTEERTLQFKLPNSSLAKVVKNYFLERDEDGSSL